MLQDLRYAVRMLLKSPGFTAMAIVILALGIGANAAIFTVVNAVLLRPLPFSSPDRVVDVKETLRDIGIGPASWPTFRDWQQQSRTFEQFAAWRPGSLNLQDVQTPERISCVSSTWNLFSTLGVSPLRGRAFVAEDENYGGTQVVVLGEGLWRKRFGADPNLVGKSITLDGVPHTVVGIMPASFHFPPKDTETELWVPLRFDPKDTPGRGDHFLWVVGRLKPGVDLANARAEMKTIAARMAQVYPVQAGWSVGMVPLQNLVVQGVRDGLLALLGAVALVLLIACANIANLLLVRAAARKREVAVRVALGASRGRVVRQLLTESVLLALLGGGFGLLLAVWGVQGLALIANAEIPRLHEASFDGKVFLFLFAISLVTGLLFGLAPALEALKPDTMGALRQAGTSTASRGQNFLRRALVVTEVALSLVLLIGAGLLLKTLANLHSVNTGLVAKNVTTFHVSLGGKDLNKAAANFYTPLLEKLQNVPGVRAAGIISMLPIEAAWTNVNIQAEGGPPAKPSEQHRAEYRTVSADFFRALRIPLLKGRDFDDRDHEEKHPVILINDALARTEFGGEDPIGKHIDTMGMKFEVIGVVGSVRQAGLEYQPLGEFYMDYRQGGVRDDMAVVVSSELPPQAVVPAIRQAVQEINPNQPIYKVQTMQQVIDASIAGRRLYLWLLGGFALIAVTVAYAGIYAVISYGAARRTQEFGLRMALGADPGSVLALILREGVLLVVIGITVGFAGAWAATRVLRNYLFEVQPTDGWTFVAVALTLSALAMLASYLPARRATKVDPMVVLRYE